MTAEQRERLVVVGVDGSGTDSNALLWAARVASRNQARLHIVHALEVPLGVVEALPLPEDPEPVAEQTAARVREQFPGLTVTAEDVPGSPAAVLMEHQDQAMVLVVGSGQRGTLGQVILGTTSLPVAMHARCPVAVVNKTVDMQREPSGVVTAAVDGSRDSVAAAAMAFAAARARGGRVRCVATWALEVVDGYVVTEPDSAEWRAIEDDLRERVTTAIAPVVERFPDVPHEVRIEHGNAARVLLACTRECDLLVMGSRGRGGFAGKLLGSVSQRVLQAAEGPVMIVKAP